MWDRLGRLSTRVNRRRVFQHSWEELVRCETVSKAVADRLGRLSTRVHTRPVSFL